MTACKSEISVALCTYNGERYVRDQLQSIAEQTVLPCEVIVCDDGSTDRTLDVIKEFSKNTSIPIKMYVNHNRLGVVKNFEQAIKYCSGDYIALSDQDDVWLPRKIELSLARMTELEHKYGQETPCLVHTDLMVANKDLQVLHKSFMRNQGLQHIYDRKKQICFLMAQNFVTGCTMVINCALREKAVPFPKGIIMHDYWMALVAATAGRIGFVQQPMILYRQHGKNAIGAIKYLSFRNLFKIFKMSDMLSGINTLLQQMRIVSVYRDGELTRDNEYIREFLNDIDEKRYRRVFLSNIRKQGVLRNMIFKCYLMFHMAHN